MVVALEGDQAEVPAGGQSVSPPARRNTCIVVVTYNPAEGLAELIKSASQQVHKIVVVDNGSKDFGLAAIGRQSGGSDICVIQNVQNVGIAAALNQGVGRAAEAGYDWALLLDQDTVPHPDMLESLSEVYNQCPIRDRVAIVGSNYIETGSNRARWPVESANGLSWTERTVVITAGSLLSLQALRSIGAFRAEYFIDCVDTEYCLRARSKGFRVIMATKALMVQNIGQATQHRLPWRAITLSNHCPLRRYYMIRNQVDLAKRYLFKEPSYVLTSSWVRFKSAFLFCLFEEDRFAKAWYAAVGLFDGLFCNFDRHLN